MKRFLASTCLASCCSVESMLRRRTPSSLHGRLAQRLAGLVGVDVPAVAAVGLAPVERGVGLVDDRLHLGGVARELGDAGGELQLLAAGADLDRAERVLDALQHLLGGRGVGAHQREHELVAAQAAAQVAGAQLALKLAGELLERLVADRMAPRVVDLLELVEVHRDDRDRVVLAGGAAQLGLQAVVERALVGQPGERVLEGERLERLLADGHLVGQPARRRRPKREIRP